MSRCGCVPKPRFGCTMSSFTTLRTPKFPGPPAYSANEKWNRDVSQCLHDHAPSGLSGGLPNQLGFLCGNKPVSREHADVASMA